MNGKEAAETRASRRLGGVLPVFQTPFHDDESVDGAVLCREIEWLFAQGANGVVMAMVSELLRLSSEERRAMAELVCRCAAEHGVVVISIGAESSAVAVEFARHAESVGADAVMAVPPVSYAVSEDELHRYYERVFSAIRLPVIVQDASGYIGQPMSIGFQVRLLEDYGDRVMFKPEAKPIGPRVSELRDATGGQAKIFEGTGGIAVVDSYRRGIVGTMPGADLCWALVELWKALEAADENRVNTISGPLCAMISMLPSLDAFIAVEKYLLVKQGVLPSAAVRGPVGYVLDKETRLEVDRLFVLLSSAVEAGR